MKWFRYLKESSDGFSLIELIAIVTIIGILVALSLLSTEALKARIRFAQIKGDIDAIAKSAYNDYSTNQVWAALSCDELPPEWHGLEMKKWPSPPCPGWEYCWEDWNPFGYPVTQVTIRKAGNVLVLGYCVDTMSGAGNCQMTDPVFPTASAALDINNMPGSHYIYCNE